METAVRVQPEMVFMAASAVLILTAQILETFSGIFSEISLADAEVLPAQEADP